MAVVTTTNLVLTANVTANALLIYVFVHIKQIAKITCKIIFVLRVSDLMVGLFAPILFTTMLYEKSCLVRVA